MAKRTGLSFYNRKKKKINPFVFREVFSWVFGILASIFLATVLVMFLGMTTSVAGDGMAPGLESGQTILVDRFLYLLSTPKKGHVVVFLPNGNEKAHYYVKRVVAAPGDHLVIKNGILYVNGLESPWVTKTIEDAGIAENDIYMGSGEYFCIGDSPQDSEDSRSANLGPVQEKDIIGKAWFHGKTDKASMGFVK